MKNLVIVESPHKAETFSKFLGKDYKVMSSVGHIRDLRKKGMSVDIDGDFSPIYEIPADKKAAIEAAVAKLKDAHKAQDIAAIDAAIKEIETTFGAAQQDILNAQAQAQANAQGAQGNPFQSGQPGAGSASHGSSDDHVTDVDFEEVH